MSSSDSDLAASSDNISDDEENMNESGSDFDQNDSFSDHSFESDTDSEQGEEDATQSSIGTLGSDASDVAEPDFWSEHLLNVEVSDFTEEVGPTHCLTGASTFLDYFLLVFPLSLFQLMVDQTNLYASQCGTRPSEWEPTAVDEMRAFIGLQIIMGIHHLPRYTMYWSTNQFLGKS